MALIKCPECGQPISDRAGTCIHCGCPIKTEQTVTCPECGQEVSSKEKTCPYCGCPFAGKTKEGSVTIQTDPNVTGMLCRYILNDKAGNVLAKLKPGEIYRAKILSDVSFYIRLSGYIGSFLEIVAYAGQENKFYVAPNGLGFSVVRQ